MTVRLSLARIVALVLAVWLGSALFGCWLGSLLRAAPVPFERPARARPSLAGSWWYAYGTGDAYEVHLSADGAYCARHWDAAGPTGGWWCGTWRRDGGQVRVRERLLCDEGACERDWGMPVAQLYKTRP
jgi:hypothetical protein